jgi:hypothetical protein
VSEFFRTGRRVLQLARSIRTFGNVVTGVEAVDIGLTLRINDIAKPGSGGHAVSYTKDPSWAAAIAALREDADTRLPGLPAQDDDPAGDAGAIKAA